MKSNKYFVLATVSLFAVCVVAGCRSSVSVLDAVRCARNWKTQGYDFDPNSMNCSQMSQKVQAIRGAKYWRQKGYYFDPNSMTRDQMDLKVKDIDRARYWKKSKGYDFDPNSMTLRQMDQQAEELERIEYWKKAGYYYDPNSQTVFLTAHKKTQLKSLASLHSTGKTGSRDQSSYTPPPTSSPSGQWQVYETTSIDGWVKGVKRGTIFKTISGNMYEVAEAVFLFEMEVRPDVTVLTNGRFYKLFIQGVDEPLLCRKLNRGNDRIISGQAVIEAQVTNDFDGLEYGKIYKLSNGQIWEQTDFYIRIHIAVRPRVTIWKEGSIYKMKVEGIDRTVAVRPLS